jgi:hypothetical protein
MTIVNRRNSVVGWLTIKAGKALARRQARRVVRSKIAVWSAKREPERRESTQRRWWQTRSSSPSA